MENSTTFHKAQIGPYTTSRVKIKSSDSDKDAERRGALQAWLAAGLMGGAGVTGAAAGYAIGRKSGHAKGQLDGIAYYKRKLEREAAKQVEKRKQAVNNLLKKLGNVGKEAISRLRNLRGTKKLSARDELDLILLSGKTNEKNIEQIDKENRLPSLLGTGISGGLVGTIFASELDSIAKQKAKADAEAKLKNLRATIRKADDKVKSLLEATRYPTQGKWADEHPSLRGKRIPEHELIRRQERAYKIMNALERAAKEGGKYKNKSQLLKAIIEKSSTPTTSLKKKITGAAIGTAGGLLGGIVYDQINQLSARDQLDLILFEEDKKKINAPALGMILAGKGLALTTLGRPKVGIQYNYDGITRGHLSQAEDLYNLLKKDPGLNVKKYQIPSVVPVANGKLFIPAAGHLKDIGLPLRREVMIPVGHVAVPVPHAAHIKWKPDYGKDFMDTKPVAPTEIARANTIARKRTLGIYGGGSGLNTPEKVKDIISNPHVLNDIDAVHVYASKRKKEVDKILEGADEAVKKKIKVHGNMSREAIKNAVARHTVNTGNAGLSTLHEIATSARPGIIWQSGPRVNYGRPANYFLYNEEWARKRGIKVAPDAQSGINEIAETFKNLRSAELQQEKAARRVVRESKEAQQKLIKEIKAKAQRVKTIKRAVGAGLVTVGGLQMLLNNGKESDGKKEQPRKG